MNTALFQLEWKGRGLGSFTLAQLRTRLAVGEISRLHRVNVDGTWRALGEWLDQIDAEQLRDRGEIESKSGRDLDLERTRNAVLDSRVHHLERQVRQQPLPAAPADASNHPAMPVVAEQPTTSGLAIASFVSGLLGLLVLGGAGLLATERLFRWLILLAWAVNVFWVLAIFYGHLALSEMRRNEALGGRGPAVAGLIFGYAVVALLATGLIFGILYDTNYYGRNIDLPASDRLRWSR